MTGFLFFGPTFSTARSEYGDYRSDIRTDWEYRYIRTMNQKSAATNQMDAQAWAQDLTAKVNAVLAMHPDADPDNVRHTLILLEKPPLERLQRSLIRGRAATLRRK